MKHPICIVIIALAVFSWNHQRTGMVHAQPVAPTPTGGPRSSHPGNAYRLPIADKAGLQEAMDVHKIVVLDSGDYTIPKSTVTLKSGYQLYGDPRGSRIPPVIVAPGTTAAVLSTVNGTVTFPASSEVTSGNVFERLIGGITVAGGTLQDNLFLHIDGGINIDTSAGGFIRNNRFIRCKAHATWPQLTLLGDAARQSYGNVFLWFNFLTPHGDATNIANQKDLTFVGFDAETWNQMGAGTNTALIKAGPMGTLRVFGVNGGNHGQHPTPAFDVAADEFQIYNNLMESSRGGTADYLLRPTNLRSLHIGSAVAKRYDDQAKDAFRLKAYQAGGADFEVNTTAFSSENTLTPEQQAILASMVVNDQRIGKPWEAPRHRPIPDPAGPDWKARLLLAKHPDSTAYIQGLIDANGVARLPAGIYYISAPLKLGRNQGIMGATADTTAIIAQSDKLDMIIANDPDAATPGGRRIILGDITLQGGANGIHFEPVGTGTRTADGKPVQALNADRTPQVDSRKNPVYIQVQYTACYFNHVTFRDMSVAGIFMDQIYALDNIFVSNLNFVNCDVGWKQKVEPTYGSPSSSGETPTMMYMDKVLLYRCQFVGNRIAMDLPGNRGCNLNAWVNCLFENNRDGVAMMTNYLSPLFANCDFVNNGGTAVVRNNRPVSFVGCRFKAGLAGSAMLDGPVSLEGCSFDRDGSTNATILKHGSNQVVMSNCLSNDMPLGLTPQNHGMVINSVMLPSDRVNQQMVLIRGASIQPILSKTTTGTTPTPQLLFGSNWSTDALLSDY